MNCEMFCFTDCLRMYVRSCLVEMIRLYIVTFSREKLAIPLVGGCQNMSHVDI